MLQKLLNLYRINISHNSSFSEVSKQLELLWEKFERRKHLVKVCPKVIAQRLVHDAHTKATLDILVDCQKIISDQIKASGEDDILSKKEEGRVIREQIHTIKKLKAPHHNQLLQLFDSFPNVLHDEVPDKSFIIKTRGMKRVFIFKPKDHVALGREWGLFDNKAGTEVSGHRFVYLTGWGARLANALEQWVIDFLLDNHFYLYSPPDIIKNKVLDGCGFKPEGEATQIYGVLHNKTSTQSLSGTGEIPLVGYYANRYISHFDKRPNSEILMCAASNCYRAEAGARGKEIRGLYRLHQFRKVEMVCLTPPDLIKSDTAFKHLLRLQEEIYTRLGLHYQQVSIPADDLGSVACRKVDIEAWMPGMGKYGEVTSASECLDYQSSRLNITCDGGFAYTLNATAVAIPRTMIAIIEAYQQKDSTIQIPHVLQPYIRMSLIPNKPGTWVVSSKNQGIDSFLNRN